MKEIARTVTVYFIILAPFAVLSVDLLLGYVFGSEVTITEVMRDWSKDSAWPEVLYVAAVLLLYYHLFRNWPY